MLLLFIKYPFSQCLMALPAPPGGAFSLYCNAKPLLWGRWHRAAMTEWVKLYVDSLRTNPPGTITVGASAGLCAILRRSCATTVLAMPSRSTR